MCGCWTKLQCSTRYNHRGKLAATPFKPLPGGIKKFFLMQINHVSGFFHFGEPKSKSHQKAFCNGRNSEIDNLEIKADFYRRQLVLESRFGLILQRSFS